LIFWPIQDSYRIAFELCQLTGRSFIPRDLVLLELRYRSIAHSLGDC